MMESRGGRRGLAIKEMSDAQRALAHGLLNTALSHRGYLQATTIMALEAILRDPENGSPMRDPAMYHVAVYRYRFHPQPSQTARLTVTGAVATSPFRLEERERRPKFLRAERV